MPPRPVAPTTVRAIHPMTRETGAELRKGIGSGAGGGLGAEGEGGVQWGHSAPGVHKMPHLAAGQPPRAAPTPFELYPKASLALPWLASSRHPSHVTCRCLWGPL